MQALTWAWIAGVLFGSSLSWWSWWPSSEMHVNPTMLPETRPLLLNLSQYLSASMDNAPLSPSQLESDNSSNIASISSLVLTFQEQQRLQQPDETKRIKVLCWVPLRSATSIEQKLISQTWSRECDKMLFVAEKGNPFRGVVAHNYTMEDRWDLWNIIHRVWALCFMEYYPEFDWYVKLDTDSYFSALNFKHFVRDMDPDRPLYTGHVTYHKKPHRIVLGAAIAISRGTLKVIGPHLPTTPFNTTKCIAKNSWSEDWQLFKCLKTYGVENATLAVE